VVKKSALSQAEEVNLPQKSPICSGSFAENERSQHYPKNSSLYPLISIKNSRDKEFFSEVSALGSQLFMG